MSFSVYAFHNPGERCEFKVSDPTPKGREKVIMYIGAVGCTQTDTDGKVFHDNSSGNTYGDVHALLDEFRAGHARVDEGAFADYKRGRAAVVLDTGDFTPDPEEEARYQAAREYLLGKLPLPEGVDSHMVLEGWMNGVDADAMITDQASTIAG
jgi:hypothetical protein